MTTTIADELARLGGREKFPRLRDDYVVLSDVDASWNCVGYVLGDTSRRWDPETGYWPDDLPREPTLRTFRMLFERHGYRACTNGRIEPGYRKLAVFAAGGIVRHVAVSNGAGWLSKCGRLALVEHATLDQIAGPEYGAPVLFMRRRLT